MCRRIAPKRISCIAGGQKVAMSAPPAARVWSGAWSDDGASGRRCWWLFLGRARNSGCSAYAICSRPTWRLPLTLMWGECHGGRRLWKQTLAMCKRGDRLQPKLLAFKAVLIRSGRSSITSSLAVDLNQARRRYNFSASSTARATSSVVSNHVFPKWRVPRSGAGPNGSGTALVLAKDSDAQR